MRPNSAFLLLGLALLLSSPCSLFPSGNNNGLAGFQKQEPQDISKRALKIIERDRQILGAIKSFRENNLLWPESFNELPPDIAKGVNLAEWHYEWKPYGTWTLENFFDFPNWSVRYELNENVGQWFLSNGADHFAISEKDSYIDRFEDNPTAMRRIEKEDREQD